MKEITMTDDEIWAQTHGIEDIPEEFRKNFLDHMFLRGYVKVFGKERYYKGDVQEFFVKIGLECPPPGGGNFTHTP